MKHPKAAEVKGKQGGDVVNGTNDWGILEIFSILMCVVAEMMGGDDGHAHLSQGLSLPLKDSTTLQMSKLCVKISTGLWNPTIQ